MVVKQLDDWISFRFSRFHRFGYSICLIKNLDKMPWTVKIHPINSIYVQSCLMMSSGGISVLASTLMLVTKKILIHKT